MGWPVIIYVGAMLVVAAISAYYAYSLKPTIKGASMKPATLDSFNITYCEEGTVVPQIYGTVRVPGNILWYGNLVTHVMHARGRGRPIAGYKYWLDIWQGLGVGLLEIIGLYVNDKAASFTDSYVYNPGTAPVDGITRNVKYDGEGRVFIYNPGEGQYHPAAAGADASAMNPVCHTFMSRWFLGENVSYVPTTHWIVKRRFPSNFPIDYAELANGSNPAAVIYDILCKAGVRSFSLSKFNAAAYYWYTQGYGINISYSEQEPAKSLIQKVFNYVDGVLRKNTAGEWELIAFTPSDIPAAEDEIKTEEFIGFSIARPGWDETYNYFVANYTDSTKDYTRRTVRLPNSAGIEMLGYRRTKSIDLTAFTDLTTVSKRMWEIAKQLSYPSMRISFKTNLKWSGKNVGDPIYITNSEYSFVKAKFRITSKNTEEIDRNALGFEAEQLLSSLFDDAFQIGGDPIGENPVYDPAPMLNQAVRRMPALMTVPIGAANFLALGAREGEEDSFGAYISYDGGIGYDLHKTLYTWSLYGVLTSEYDSSHNSIDDPAGIYLDAYREDPIFSTLSDEDFAVTERYALIGDEILKFQTVNPGTGSTDLILTRILRGQFGTSIQTHGIGTSIWLFELSESNILDSVPADKFHLKYVPAFGVVAVDISLVTAIYYSSSSSSSSSSSRSSSSSSRSSSCSSSSSILSVSSSSSSRSSSSSSSSCRSSSSSSSFCRSSSSSSSSSCRSSSSSSSSSSCMSSSSSSCSSSSSRRSLSSSSSSSSCFSSSSSSSSCRSSSSSSRSSSSSSSSSSCLSSSSSSSCRSSSSSSCRSSSSSSCRSSSSSSSYLAITDSGLTFIPSGNADWFSQSDIYHTSPPALRSGLITHLQTSTIEWTAPVETFAYGTLSFWWKVSSEPGLDYLTGYVNELPISQISGEVDWTRQSYGVASGQVVKFTYSKDGSVNLGSDCGFLDDFVWTSSSSSSRSSSSSSRSSSSSSWSSSILTFTSIFDNTKWASAGDCIWDSGNNRWIPDPNDHTDMLLLDVPGWVEGYRPVKAEIISDYTISDWVMGDSFYNIIADKANPRIDFSNNLNIHILSVDSGTVGNSNITDIRFYDISSSSSSSSLSSSSSSRSSSSSSLSSSSSSSLSSSSSSSLSSSSSSSSTLP